ncbi:MAG: hypothetical protein V3U92_14880 [Cellulophaga sp.]
MNKKLYEKSFNLLESKISGGMATSVECSRRTSSEGGCDGGDTHMTWKDDNGNVEADIYMCEE